MANLTIVALMALAQAGYGPGQIHPNFELPLLSGGSGRLSEFRGKKVIVFNFAAW